MRKRIENQHRNYRIYVHVCCNTILNLLDFAKSHTDRIHNTLKCCSSMQMTHYKFGLLDYTSAPYAFQNVPTRVSEDGSRESLILKTVRPGALHPREAFRSIYVGDNRRLSPVVAMWIKQAPFINVHSHSRLHAFRRHILPTRSYHTNTHVWRCLSRSFLSKREQQFLANCILTVALMLQCYVCLSVVCNVRIVVKRCVLPKNCMKKQIG